MLNERGIKAVTPSALSTPSGINSFTPTATPCNSPDGSPNQSRSTSPIPYRSLKLPGILGTGADLLRRTIIGEEKTRTRGKLSLSRTDKKVSYNLKWYFSNRTYYQNFSFIFTYFYLQNQSCQ